MHMHVGLVLAQVGPTILSVLTPDELYSTTGFLPRQFEATPSPPPSLPCIPKGQASPTTVAASSYRLMGAAASNDSAPVPSFDWRSRGVVTRVKNQVLFSLLHLSPLLPCCNLPANLLVHVSACTPACQPPAPTLTAPTLTAPA